MTSILFAQAVAQGTRARAESQAPALQLETMRREGHTYLVNADDGARVQLTLDPRLQEPIEDVLRTFQIPYAGAVVVSIPDGRVLAMVGRSAAQPNLGARELALTAWAPAASVFKVVSAAALVVGGLSGATRTCYHGGVSSIVADNLIDVPAIDRRCETLAFGLGKSRNAILAKLATRHLTGAQLTRMGRAFGFEETIPFDLPIAPSRLDVPTDTLEFARTAAGFWHSTLSPMHGALLAAAIANHGEMPAPTLIDRAFDAQGRELALALPASGPRRVVTLDAAREVGHMMELTTRIGTAKATFRDKRGNRYLPVEVAGKTGTLSAQTDQGYLGYSWFVGYAPAEHPSIAFAVVLGNQAQWRIKATYVARRIVAEHVAARGDRGAAKMLARR
ncbi:MAG TPA: penicillin-binding transpeptidase domain-containing protein [Polyangia bacterium]|nr:penicillin-binding transpeptidase domain-containing protein [Polyangia bacterium]